MIIYFYDYGKTGLKELSMANDLGMGLGRDWERGMRAGDKELVVKLDRVWRKRLEMETG